MLVFPGIDIRLLKKHGSKRVANLSFAHAVKQEKHLDV